jgi:uncharacterized protein YecE (DUF72 family)
MNLYVGTSGYSYTKWKGSFYPAKLPTNEMLGFYSTRFRSVEINNSFYRMPTVSVMKEWASQVPADFRFVIKAPREITHIKRLANVRKPVSSLLKTAATLKERLGPLLFQLPPNFKKNTDLLQAVLAQLPEGFLVAFEFRHPSWFDEEIFELLREHRTALCVADAEDDLIVPFAATAGWGYLRLRRPDYDDEALKLWAKRIREQSWQDCFVFFKHEDEGKGPRMATRLLELLSTKSKGKAPPKQTK